MANTVTTLKTRFNTAEQFKESFSEASPTISYVFIGNHLAYPNESVPSDISDTILDEKVVWNNMIGGKKITGNDVEHVVPRVNWTASTKYKQYDDRSNYESLLTANTSLNTKPMYVITTARNVYMCLSNNTSANSTVEPTGDYSTSNGVIDTADGYRWKYLYNIKPSNKFITEDWIPVPTSNNQLDYTVNSLGIVDGELTTIIVANGGSGYKHSNVNVVSFISGTNILQISNTTIVLNEFNISSLSNLTNMSISGQGIRPATFISSINVASGLLTLSTETNATGGNNVPLSLTSRVLIAGDGTRSEGRVYLNDSGNVANIKVTTVGINYSFANAVIYGSGTGANTRVILSPKYGFGYNPAKQLSAKNIMISVRIGEIDSTEGGVISANTNFRQYGILRDPHKYGQTSVVSSGNANSAISQTTKLSMVAGGTYQQNEFVYQGALSNPSAYGYVVEEIIEDGAEIIKLSGVRGVMTTGLNLLGANSAVQRTVVSVKNPEFQPFSGDILHVENVTAIDREDGQAEDIKFVLKF
jgi:hypothetical protein